MVVIVIRGLLSACLLANFSIFSERLPPRQHQRQVDRVQERRIGIVQRQMEQFE
jgi:hypothetical protein